MKGKIHKIYDTVTTQGKQDPSKEYKTRLFVIDTEDQYNPFIAFELFGDKCNLVDNVKEGDLVEVEYNISSREWKDKWFTKLGAWQVNKASEEVAESVARPADESDDLPF